MIPPTPKPFPKHKDPEWVTIRNEANRSISFASIIEKAKAEQRTEAPHQNEGDTQ